MSSMTSDCGLSHRLRCEPTKNFQVAFQVSSRYLQNCREFSTSAWKPRLLNIFRSLGDGFRVSNVSRNLLNYFAFVPGSPKCLS